jgi:hypothetical protein
MYDPLNHPNLQNGLGGRGKRFVKDTRAHRKLRFDAVSDNRLMEACRLLSDPHNAKDTVSCSMVARRAIRLYAEHLNRSRMSDPLLWHERQAVREHSQLPSGRRRKKPVAAPVETASAPL